MEKWARANYLTPLPLYEGRARVTGSREHINLSRYAATQGAVLLKNDDNILPLDIGTRVALFGNGSIDYIPGGGGSGWVYTKYTKNMYEAFSEKAAMGKVFVVNEISGFYKDYLLKTHGLKLDFAAKKPIEPEIPERFLGEYAKDTTAIITISRFSSEGSDRTENEGDFLLTKDEQKMIDSVCTAYSSVVVVLNVGGMIDTSWFKNNSRIKGVLLAWQGGMEGAGAVADLVCGDETPSGRLTDTLAGSFFDYPSADTFNASEDYVDYYEDIYVGYRYFETVPGANKKVNYPFGFGLSYTTFEYKNIKVCDNGEDIFLTCDIENTGKFAGREVAEVYYCAPAGVLGRPRIVLAAFAKTRKLIPGESERVEIRFPVASMASYDDTGKLCKSAYLLEKGEYKIYIGSSVRDTQYTGYSYMVEEPFVVTEQLTERCAPCALEKRLLCDGNFEKLPKGVKPRGYRHADGFDYNEDLKDSTLFDVVNGKITLDEFICSLTDDELIDLTGGHPNAGVANTCGVGANKTKGVPNIMTADGPAGLRLEEKCGCPTTSWPCSSLLACSWDKELAYEVGVAAAKEVKENNIDIWLAPAINIHRNPLCGRNFEYYSEDPLIAGIMSAALINGIQSQNISCALKHFACNNKETNRLKSDSRLSERSLREIYIKAFEIAVKEASPRLIMTSYNLINGCYASENRDLLTEILRGEWGYKGAITTDWNNHAEPVNEILAGNDVKMPHRKNEVLREALADGRLTRGDIAVCVKRLLTLICTLD